MAGTHAASIDRPDRSSVSAAEPDLGLRAGRTGSQAVSIEQLMQIDVTLAARRPAPIATAPTAISVVTGDDIRRAGATTLADAVALADGVHVARFNNGTWSVTARGFAAVAGNKMLAARSKPPPRCARPRRGRRGGCPRADRDDAVPIRRDRDHGRQRGGGIPAIAVTAYASVSDRASALASGYEAHVAKPFEPDALAQTVAMLRRAQIRRS